MRLRQRDTLLCMRATCIDIRNGHFFPNDNDIKTERCTHRCTVILSYNEWTTWSFILMCGRVRVPLQVCDHYILCLVRASTGAARLCHRQRYVMQKYTQKNANSTFPLGFSFISSTKSLWNRCIMHENGGWVIKKEEMPRNQYAVRCASTRSHNSEHK